MFRSASALGRLVQYYTYNTRTPLRPCMQCKSVGPLLSDTSLSRFRSTQPHVATTHHPRLISTERERQRERAQNPPLQRETWRENTGMKDSFFSIEYDQEVKQTEKTNRETETDIAGHVRNIQSYSLDRRMCGKLLEVGLVSDVPDALRRLRPSCARRGIAPLQNSFGVPRISTLKTSDRVVEPEKGTFSLKRFPRKQAVD